MADRPQLHLVDAVIFETFRLVSPSPFTPPRLMQKDVTLKGYTIPKGSFVFANTYVVHRNPEVYPDPAQFKLEHFLEADGSLKKASQEHFMPFGKGMSIYLKSFNLISVLDTNHKPGY